MSKYKGFLILMLIVIDHASAIISDDNSTIVNETFLHHYETCASCLLINRNDVNWVKL